MSYILDMMRKSRAKSVNEVSLLDHSLGVLLMVDQMIRTTDYISLEQATVLRLGAFLHDIGKCVPEFQMMLHQPTSYVQKIKHEGQTYHFYEQIIQESQMISEWIGNVVSCEMVNGIDLADVFAFAVTHHGVFYSSSIEGMWQARREWTRMHPQEDRRITLADLLLHYYPLGGSIIVADLLHSHQLATGSNHMESCKQLCSLLEWRHYLQEHRENLLSSPEVDRVNRLPTDLLELLLT